MTAGRFDGLTVVVTGAGSGLGRVSAQRMAAEGANVVAVDIDADSVVETVASLATQSIAVIADVSDESQVQHYIDKGIDRFGRLDLHHLNAGIFGSHLGLPDLLVEDFDRVMAVNVRGQFLGVRAAFRQYREQGSTGAIVVTASIAGLTGSADLMPYVISKHADIGLVRAAALYGGPLGIRVNAVAPGIVPTDLFATADAGPSGGKHDMVRRASTTPLRRAGTAQEIAGVTAFLLSADAAYVTGQVVSVDGGATSVNTVRGSGGAGAWDYAAFDDQLYQGWKRDKS